MGTSINSASNSTYIDGYMYTTSAPVYTYPYTMSMTISKSSFKPLWLLKEKDLYKHENVRIFKSKKYLYEIHTDRYVVLVNSMDNAIRIYNVGGSDEVLLETDMSPYDAFSMFTQHEDGEIVYANAFDINVKIENMLML